MIFIIWTCRHWWNMYGVLSRFRTNINSVSFATIIIIFCTKSSITQSYCVITVYIRMNELNHNKLHMPRLSNTSLTIVLRAFYRISILTRWLLFIKLHRFLRTKALCTAHIMSSTARAERQPILISHLARWMIRLRQTSVLSHVHHGFWPWNAPGSLP